MEPEDELRKIRIDAGEQLGAVPKILKELQELVPLLSVAYSTDGRTFGYEAPLSMPVPMGSYVALSAQNSRTYLGQVDPLQRRYAHGTGVILGRLEGEAYIPTTSEYGFQSADLSRANERLVGPSLVEMLE